MGVILNHTNLDTYLTWRRKPWGVADLFYERLPMLAVRNYLGAGDAHEWPLCWTEGRGLRRGLSLCIEFLRDWQAFRPGAARTLQKPMERLVPKVVTKFQRKVIDKIGSARLWAVSRKKKRADQLIELMSQAVGEISGLKRLKTPTPMLGSKVMHFFFPEFFPVWDTAFVKKALEGLSKRGLIELTADQEYTAASEYVQYLNLMVNDLRGTPRGDLARLDERLLRRAAEDYHDKFLPLLVKENLADRSPILFELCVIGYGRRTRVL